jgi:CIC family chloride channel protein
MLRVGGGTRRFWLVVVATGALSGLGAGGLLALLGAVQRAAWPAAGRFLAQVEAAGPLRRVLVPAAGGLLVSAVTLLVRRPLAGHGTARIIEIIWSGGRAMALGRTLLRGTVSIGAVGMGASLGREGALVQAGTAAGSWLAARLGIDDRQARVIVACGASSGIAAAYGAPIGGALFGLEVLLGSFALELLGPIVISCAIATTVARAVIGARLEYVIPEYQLLGPSTILLGVALAPALGVAAAAWGRVIRATEAALDRAPSWLAPALPPVVLAAVGAASIRFPFILGNGLDTVQNVLSGEVGLATLAALPALKLLATGACAGAGVPGGLFTPSLVYGAALGGLAGEVLAKLVPGAPPVGALALLGMAGVLAGTTHAAVSAVVIIFEMTGDYGVILPLMVTAAVATAVSRAVEPDSVYTAPLRRRGIPVPELPRPDWLRSRTVAQVVEPGAAQVRPAASFEEVLRKLLALEPGHDLYVTSEDGELLGVIRLDALKGTIAEGALLGMIVAADVVDRSVEPITEGMSLTDVAGRFGETDLERLPVVDGARRLVGTVALREVVALGRF